MNFRLAVMQDLPQIKAVFNEIIEDMNRNKIEIWDDIFPCAFFEDDIKNNQLYILVNDGEIVSAIALLNSISGYNSVEWEDNHAKALYMSRFGVNVNYKRKGIGGLVLQNIKEIARTFGAEYLRLFVVDINEPAIRLYEKNGFARADGIYDEVIDDDLVLHEFGYETKL